MRDTVKGGVLTVTLLLAAQAAVYHSRPSQESTPMAPALSSFPRDLNGWRMQREGVIEKEVQDVLQADDLLTRDYVPTTGARIPANLFIAYFRTQRTGKAPHSPKNCLPGSGWLWINSDFLNLRSGGPEPLEVNRYVVARGEEKSVVIYWYQTPKRTVASEYMAKAYLVADSLRYNRSDTALVRVVVSVVDNDVERASAEAVALAETVYPQVRHYLPN